jgi:Mycothiol maleylpyruvate isomerase N-terminal domain
MNAVRTAYADAAAAAVALLREPAVAAAWDQPSALPHWRVSGLAGHLARQVTTVPLVLGQPAGDQAPITLMDHYARVTWLGAGPEQEINVAIRRDSDQAAADGPAVLAARAAATLEALRRTLPAEPADRVVHLPWGPWSLSLNDFLITRMMEIAVHSDDLASSVGVPAAELPPAVTGPVLKLLSQLAVRRHGFPAVLRALSRAERAPATIAAF